MAPPIKSIANPTQNHGTADASRENPPSNNLWIGNVSSDVSETELKALFEKYGKVDSVTTYSSRNYAFVHFKEVEGARSAKQGLQGLILRGNPLKIEFAKPVGEILLISRGFRWLRLCFCKLSFEFDLVGFLNFFL